MLVAAVTLPSQLPSPIIVCVLYCKHQIVISKILEKGISTQLTEYLEKNNLLNESQYAYHNNSSTEQALVNVMEQIYKSIDKGKISLLVLLDLSKDRV